MFCIVFMCYILFYRYKNIESRFISVVEHLNGDWMLCTSQTKSNKEQWVVPRADVINM